MEEFISVCKNPWCKAHFKYTERDFTINEEGEKKSPTICKKCKSFDTELSGGVSWTEKKYEGDAFDDSPHEITYRITKFR